MPVHRRLPKFGFKSAIARVTAGVRLGDIAALEGDTVDLAALKKANLVRRDTQFAKVFLAGKIDRAVQVKGLRVTKGARAAIEAAGGSVE